MASTGDRPSLVFGRCGRNLPRWANRKYAGLGRQIVRSAIAGGNWQREFGERCQVDYRAGRSQVWEG